MGLLDKIFNRNRTKRHLDSFALTRESLWQSIADAVKIQQSMDKSVFLISHFLDSFTSSQSLVETNQLDYDILEYPFSPQWFKETGTDSKRVHLALADLLTPLEETIEQLENQPGIALMVMEVHPLAWKDDLLMEFAQCLSGRVEIGYFMALEDAVLQRTVSKETIDVLRQLGLGDNDLITSSLISKRLKKLLRIQTAKVIEANEANSAIEWYEMHDAALKGQ